MRSARIVRGVKASCGACCAGGLCKSAAYAVTDIAIYADRVHELSGGGSTAQSQTTSAPPIAERQDTTKNQSESSLVFRQ